MTNFEVLINNVLQPRSDTTRTAITLGMLYLTENQDIYKRLQVE